MSKKIRVAIVGVGNCASALCQGLAYYRGRNDEAGLITPVLAGYRPDDIEIVAAFDVARGKVGAPLGMALGAEPNCTLRFAPFSFPGMDVIVSRGPTMDGLGRYLADVVEESDAPEVDVTSVLEESGAEVLVSYLPVGSELAAAFYATAAIQAKCAMVNCMPAFLASRPEIAEMFRAAGVPIVGDDIKSQVGATIVHRVLTELMRDRGVRLLRTSQLNVGGNTDFLNMLERDRLKSKKISKTQAVTSVVGHVMSARDVHVGPSDHVQWLDDRKWAYIRLEGEAFGGAPLNIELKLEVHDSPNSAGVVMDAIRCARLGLDRGESGPLIAASAWYMKSPPAQAQNDLDCRQALDEWIAEGGEA